MKNPHLIRRLTHHLLHKRRCYITMALLLVLGMWLVKQAGEWEAQQLECNVTRLPAEALPGAGPLRIAQISDLHNSPDLFRKGIDYLREKKPDLIVFTGDLVTADARFRRTRWAIDGFRELAAIAPTVAILGNHDYEKLEQVERVLQTAGIPLLRNQSLNWRTPSGSMLCIIGLGDWNEGDEQPWRCMLPNGRQDKPVLLLSHDPESRWLLRDYDWDLMLSGHTHGGQIGIPFTGICLSFRSSMPAGLYPFDGGRQVHVSRGVGSILNMRFFCAPEINLIEIQPEN